ncbi:MULTISPECIES: invasion associated locus B family protein [unclassified Rhizobium]|uniref:invasion associated locus B family protein n=1 Tax=unclassified Rhizobium TaxID=2613769 RepID=UPI003822D5D1
MLSDARLDWQFAALEIAMIEQVNRNIPIAQQQHCGDWTVFIESGAVAEAPGRHCAISQTQFDMDTCRRVLSIELFPENDGLRGALVLPDGLLRQDGVILQCDGAAPGPVLPFSTTTRLGCIVELNLGAGMIASLQYAHGLYVKAVSVETGSEEIFPISLNGFFTALNLALSLSSSRAVTNGKAPSLPFR